MAKVRASLAGMESRDVARIAVKGMFRRKVVITPGFGIKMGRIAAKILPDRLLLSFAMRTQSKKLG